MVTFAAGGEAVVQLDREQKHVDCWIKSSCEAFGSSIVDRPPIGLTIDDLCGSSRSRVLVTARQIAMYLCRELTDLSLPKIGQAFGGRDHTTVMHANRKIRELMAERRSIYNQVTELTNRIKQQSRS